MRVRFPGLFLLIAGVVSLASACATAPRTDTDGQAAVQVYELNPFVGKPYDIVGRIWTGSWRSAFWVPSYPSRDEAIASMQTEAARLKADALVSVSCVDQHGSTWFKGTDPAFLCYGIAIRLPQRQG